MKIFPLAAFVLLTFTIKSQSPVITDKALITQKINDFFTALEKRDTALYRSLVMPQGQIWRTRPKDGVQKSDMRSFVTDIENLSKGTDLYIERAISMDIQLEAGIASAWVPYTFDLNGKRSHCGVDVFTFMLVEGQWKITSLAYTVEPDGCD